MPTAGSYYGGGRRPATSAATQDQPNALFLMPRPAVSGGGTDGAPQHSPAPIIHTGKGKFLYGPGGRGPGRRGMTGRGQWRNRPKDRHGRSLPVPWPCCGGNITDVFQVNGVAIPTAWFPQANGYGKVPDPQWPVRGRLEPRRNPINGKGRLFGFIESAAGPRIPSQRGDEGAETGGGLARANPFVSFTAGRKQKPWRWLSGAPAPRPVDRGRLDNSLHWHPEGQSFMTFTGGGATATTGLTSPTAPTLAGNTAPPDHGHRHQPDRHQPRSVRPSPPTAVDHITDANPASGDELGNGSRQPVQITQQPIRRCESEETKLKY